MVQAIENPEECHDDCTNCQEHDNAPSVSVSGTQQREHDRQAGEENDQYRGREMPKPSLECGMGCWRCSRGQALVHGFRAAKMRGNQRRTVAHEYFSFVNAGQIDR